MIAMKKNRPRVFSNRKAVSVVVASVILCAVVVTIGGMVWGFSLNSSSVMQRNYFNEVLPRVDKTRERFMIENVNFNNATSKLRVWVYNYGQIDINVTTHVYLNGTIKGQLTGQAITRGTVKQLDVTVQQPVYPGVNLIVRVATERGSVEYESCGVS